MDLSGSSEVGASDVTAMTVEAPKKAKGGKGAKAAADESGEPVIYPVEVDHQPRFAAHRFRQGHAQRPLSSARRDLSGPLRSSRLGLCRRCRACPAALRLHLQAVVHAGDPGSVERRHRARPAHLLLSRTRSPTASRASSTPGTRMSGWPRAAAASAPIGAMFAASASRSASTARPAASSPSSG